MTLSFCLRAIHALGIMLLPFLPGAASKIVSAFGREASTASWRGCGGRLGGGSPAYAAAHSLPEARGSAGTEVGNRSHSTISPFSSFQLHGDLGG